LRRRGLLAAAFIAGAGVVAVARGALVQEDTRVPYRARLERHRGAFLSDLALLKTLPLLRLEPGGQDAGPWLNLRARWIPPGLDGAFRQGRTDPGGDVAGHDRWDYSSGSPFDTLEPYRVGMPPWPDVRALLAADATLAPLCLRSSGLTVARLAIPLLATLAPAERAALARALPAMGAYLSLWVAPSELDPVLAVAPDVLACLGLTELTETAARMDDVLWATHPQHLRWLDQAWERSTCPAAGFGRLWKALRQAAAPEPPTSAELTYLRGLGDHHLLQASEQMGYLDGYAKVALPE
jgi:hypothetical protein